MSQVLIALPDHDFDPTETVMPWDALRREQVAVVFATESGRAGACDPRLLTGLPFRLGARRDAVALYHELERDAAFRNPIRYEDIEPPAYAALVLPGGHAPGMRAYLESLTLREKVLGFFQAGRTVAAICHGTVVLARTVDPETGRSIIHGRRMTALTKMMERSAWWLTAWKLGRYFRTYSEYVEDEVERALGDRKRFARGPLVPSYDNPFVVEDGRLITARYPGDARAFGAALAARLRRQASR